MCIVSKPDIPEPPTPPKSAEAPDIREAARIRAKRKGESRRGRRSTMLTGPRGEGKTFLGSTMNNVKQAPVRS